MILKSGYKPFRYADGSEDSSGQNWWVLSLDHDLPAFLDENQSYSGGPGREYAHRVTFREGKRFILAKQSVGLDV